MFPSQSSQMEVCALDNRTPLPVLDKTSSYQNGTAYKDRDAGEDREREISILLGKSAADGNIGYSTIVLVSEIKRVRKKSGLTTTPWHR